MGLLTPRWQVVADALADDDAAAAPAEVVAPMSEAKGRADLGAYHAASRSDRTADWTDRDPGPQTISEESPLIRARSRDLCRNNPHAKSAVSRLVSGLVGTGIRPQVRTGDEMIRAEIAGPTWKRGARVRVADYLEWLWDVWQRDCYRSGRTGVYGLQAMSVRGMIESGGSLLRKRITLRDGLTVGLQLQVIEDDFLDASKTESYGGNEIVQGVEFNPVDQIVAYWLHRKHPSGRGSWSEPSVRVDAAEIIHLWDQPGGRPGQVRGIPWLAPVALALRDLDGYADAELVRRQVAACLAVLIQTDDEAGTDFGVTSVGRDGRPISALKPGLIARVRSGESITTISPPPAGDYGPYLDRAEHRVAAGVGVTYEDMTGDLSKVNYSSIRYGSLGFRRWVDSFQELTLGPLLMDPMWSWFVDACQVSRVLPLGFPVPPVEWQPQRHDDVDALKERNADARDLANGTTSIQRVIRRRGDDPEQVRREIAEDMLWLQGIGLAWPAATAGRVTEDPQAAQ